MKVALSIGVLLLGLAIALEIGLRLFLGFGNPPLYVSDPALGYLLAPNQKTRRFGNRIQINQYSMRSPDVAITPQAQTTRVLLLGDSVVNGAWWTDQSATLSALIHQQLTASGSQNEVLNASANSWGPPNQLAYLQRFGTFTAQVIVLLINTDDLFAGRPNPAIVGRDRNYPDQKPPLALVEVFQRYFARSQPIPPPLSPQPEDLVGFNLEAIQGIRAIAQDNQAQFVLAITPLLREIGQPGPRDYELKARQRLKDLTQTGQILYIDFLQSFNTDPQPQGLYRDHIHLSPQGNQLVSQTLYQALEEVLESSR
ncbi:MAG: SGNH/GDSL hydrolase family protein [Oscillatoriales cyanobacterium RM2_1_1]|nr:SGNH/GDSL hydrolase family protein [Oscillatoriales cyanobacterium SM2_3_0]NJO44739.1 SGNH/GDSL hydrolase family protein [Oscillatoriales cyanobacterium RM2_1_1]